MSMKVTKSSYQYVEKVTKSRISKPVKGNKDNKKKNNNYKNMNYWDHM